MAKNLKLTKIATFLACLQLASPLVAAESVNCGNNVSNHCVHKSTHTIENDTIKRVIKGTAFTLLTLGIGGGLISYFCRDNHVSEAMKTSNTIPEEFRSELGKDYLEEFKKFYDYNLKNNQIELIEFFDNHFSCVEILNDSLFYVGYNTYDKKCKRNPFCTIKGSGKHILITGADHTSFTEEYIFWEKIREEMMDRIRVTTSSTERYNMLELVDRVSFRLDILKQICMENPTDSKDFPKWTENQFKNNKRNIKNNKDTCKPLEKLIENTYESFEKSIDKKDKSEKSGKELYDIFKLNFKECSLENRTVDSLEREYKFWHRIIKKTTPKGNTSASSNWRYLQAAISEKRTALKHKISELNK